MFADDDYEEVIARLAETLQGWGCWDDAWEVPAWGGICQARQRLGPEPLEELFGQVAVPVAEEDTAGAFPGPWRLMSAGGMEWDVPDSPASAAAFGYSGTGGDKAAGFPRARVVTISACGSHAAVAAAAGQVAGGKGRLGALAGRLWPRLEEDWLLLADRNFSAGTPGAPRRGPGRRCCGGSRRTCGCRSWRSSRTGRGGLC